MKRTLTLIAALVVAAMTMTAQPLEPITLPGGIQIMPNEHPLTPDECLKYEHAPAEVDTGLTVNWGPTYFVSNPNYFGLSPRISVTGDYVYVGYSGQGHGTEKPYLCTSIDRGGSRWHTQSVLPIPPFSDGPPAVAGLGRTVHVVETHYNSLPVYYAVYYWCSTNAGLTFNPQPAPIMQNAFHPSISVMGNFINVIAHGDSELVHCLSVNGGVNFLPPDSIAPFSVGMQPTRLAACQNYVYAAFLGRCNSTNQLEIYFTRSTDYGRTFETAIMVSSTDQYHSQRPSLGYSEAGDVYVGWYDYKFSPYGWTGDILLRISHNFGASFEEEYQLTFDHLETTSMISAQDSQVHIVYEKYVVGTLQESELYYKNSSDRGVTWSNEIRLTYSHKLSDEPDLAVKNDTLHLVWADKRYTTSFDVFYRRGIVLTPEQRSKITENNYVFQAKTTKSIPLTIYPNPYNSVTQILFNLAQLKEINLSIINLQGREVINLCHQALNPGDHSYAWHGVNQAGQPVSAGVYLAVLKIDGQVQLCRKIVYLK
jgi:hypothetical protein